MSNWSVNCFDADPVSLVGVVLTSFFINPGGGLEADNRIDTHILSIGVSSEAGLS